MFSFLLTYLIWGTFALLIGLFAAGVGVVPIALLATALTGQWGLFGNVIYGLVLLFCARMLGLYLIAKAENDLNAKAGNDSGSQRELTTDEAEILYYMAHPEQGAELSRIRREEASKHAP